jgi:hypothetical protein
MISLFALLIRSAFFWFVQMLVVCAELSAVVCADVVVAGRKKKYYIEH